MRTNTLDQTHYTTAQAAEKLGKTTGRVRQMARAGELPGAEVFGTGYIIPRSIIDKRAKAGASAAADAPRKSKPAAKSRSKAGAKRVSRAKGRK